VNEKNRNLLLRVVSALVLLPVVLGLLWAGGWWSAGLMGTAAGICASEYLLIVHRRLGASSWLAIAGAALLPLLPVLAPGAAWSYAFFTVGGLFLVAWTYHLVRGPLKEAPVHASHALTGMVYGGLGLAALSWLRLLPEEGLGWVIAALVITWGNDTCAYFAGRFLGRHKLYPEVSPNKTWEGFFGGMAGSLLGMVILKLGFYPFLGWGDVVGVGLLGGIFGPIGDLVESMLKRAYGVKDSGKIIPGHGGLLDRIDALVFNAPMVFAWVAFIRPALGA
jgi:phosphatidate cytidylyltransferase